MIPSNAVVPQFETASPSRSLSLDEKRRMAKDLPKEGAASTSLSALAKYEAVSTALVEHEVNGSSP